MAGAHNLAASFQKASIGGNTATTRSLAETPGAPAPKTISEGLADAGLLGEMDQIFAGGIHPEQIFSTAARQLEQASNSLRGPHGGLRPAIGSGLALGPAGSAVSARAQGILSRLKGLVK